MTAFEEIPPRPARRTRKRTLLSIEKLSKSFAGADAISEVDLELVGGEIHALLGQNGSGKSTLIKILAGYHAPDSGRIEIEGQPLRVPVDPVEAHHRGLRFIHQDLALIDSLSVLDNLSGGHYHTRFGQIVPREERRRARKDLDAFGIEIDEGRAVRELSPVERAMVAIVRAARPDSREHGPSAPRLMILDEPTASLPQAEAKTLFGFLQLLVAAERAAVLIVTHRLREVFEHADHLSVLRDGRLVEQARVGDVDEGSIVAAMVGRNVSIGAASLPRRQDVSTSNIAVVRGLSGTGVDGVDLEIRHGEVLGVTGLSGMGHDEIPYLLAGATVSSAGTISFGGTSIRPDSPAAAMKAGIFLVPGDRQRQGTIPTASLRENITLPIVTQFWRHGFLRLRSERVAAHRLADTFQVVPQALERPMATFSGGNQQKAIFARWGDAKPRWIVLHQPTQGVDVAARRVLLDILRRWSADGIGVLICSVDHEEIAAVCDRVLIMYEGRVRAEIEGPATAEQLEVACQTVARTSEDR